MLSNEEFAKYTKQLGQSIAETVDKEYMKSLKSLDFIAVRNLREFFMREWHKEAKDIKVDPTIAEDGSQDYKITAMLRDIRTGEKEEWVALSVPDVMLTSNKPDLLSAIKWKRVEKFVPEENQHDWGKSKDGIVVCSRCGDFRGMRNDKGFCPLTAPGNALPGPSNSETR